MKKLFFAAYSLDIGGIETALVTLLNCLSKKYAITLCLEKKEGIFLDEISKNVEVIEYTPNNSKNIFFRKFWNMTKRIRFILTYRNKFDFSVCYATYSHTCNFTGKVASKNSALWVHSDYLTIFKNDEKKMKKFFKKLNYSQYQNIVFVSQQAKRHFDQIIKFQNTVTIYNLINTKKMLKQVEEPIAYKKDLKTVTFLNIGRHEEVAKKLTRLIEASKKLKNDGYSFRILLVGEGQDTIKYKKLVKKYHLEKEILFLGKQKNPYPYFKISDCLVLTSDYEGYPVVYQEAFVLGLPIITTEVSDSKQIIENKYGIVTKKNVEDVYCAMKQFCENGYAIKENFDTEKFNQEQLKKIEKLIEERK